ncbi:MAG TPA: hypothetical protein VJQ53_07230 [Candidatus Eisenbacteria bacterium]|nr:hypothetical protein [Candidatus Eisenbacteria bacterium]
MVHIMSLWIPILLSAVLVFIVSSIIHMVLGYHRSDYKKLPSEDAVLEALRKFNIPPGDYHFPRPDTMKAMKDPAFIEKRTKGPVGLMTIMKPGPPAMGRELFQWFVYIVVVGIFAAYVAGRALAPGAPYLSVFRFVGTTAFACYSMALVQDHIWYKRSRSATLKSMFDGLVYACVTAGVFGWLWPD